MSSASQGNSMTDKTVLHCRTAWYRCCTAVVSSVKFEGKHVLPASSIGFSRCCRQDPGLTPTGKKLLLMVLHLPLMLLWSMRMRTRANPVPLASGERVRAGKQHAVPALTFYPLIATEFRLQETKLTTCYRGDTPPHQHGVEPPSASLIIRASELKKLSLLVSHAPPLRTSQ